MTDQQERLTYAELWLHPESEWREIVRDEAPDGKDGDEVARYEARVEEMIRSIEPLTPPSIAMMLIDLSDAATAARATVALLRGALEEIAAVVEIGPSFAMGTSVQRIARAALNPLPVEEGADG